MARSQSIESKWSPSREGRQTNLGRGAPELHSACGKPTLSSPSGCVGHSLGLSKESPAGSLEGSPFPSKQGHEVFYEEDVPAQQPAPCQDARFPDPHEDEERPNGVETSSCQGPPRPRALTVMKVAGRYRVVQRQDHAVPSVAPRPLLGREQPLDIRIWRWASGLEPMLLVNASRKQGGAVQRNRFRRRVRMAFLKILREDPAQDDLGYVVWVRPARGAAKGCLFSFHEIESQLRLALSRWEPR